MIERNEHWVECEMDLEIKNHVESHVNLAMDKMERLITNTS
jgi:hypothetical protein